MIATKLLMSSGGVAIAIAASVRSPDIVSLARAAGWSGAGPIALTINSGVDVVGLTIPATIPHDLLALFIKTGARIGGVYNSGHGLTVATRIRATNDGQIFSGGGRGGAGGNAWIAYGSTTVSSVGGNGGNGAGFTDSGAITLQSSVTGWVGETKTYSGAMTGGTRPWATSGDGGSGGAIGAAGVSGGRGTIGGTYDSGNFTQGIAGGAAGNAVVGNSLITWVKEGTITGPKAG